ncbi:MAG: hypothetical protein KJ964_00550 [Verrucomicrobia bacterium]|nr:hypothetical protein [Verrucomicrobiota bacterium]MBU1736171.1 hypothetical protein [Verrucomicrobiota bacterium]MBU1856771.1 hypothetical protein [Verrucomicrobiota bacterium]
MKISSDGEDLPDIPHQRAVDKRFRYVCWWLTIFGISIGFFEAAVVADLRAIFCPDNNLFPLCIKVNRLGLIEIGREFFSLVILVAVACLAGWESKARVACFVILFGLWDIFYYVFLKLIIDWPASLLTWDLLFLIPVPWVAPVIAPVLVSLAFIGGGFLVLRMSARGIAWRCNRWGVIGFLLAYGIIFWSFILDWRHIAAGGVPRSFPWGIFCAGELLLIWVFSFVYRGSLSRASHETNH